MDKREEIKRLDAIWRGNAGSYLDELHIGVEAMLRRQIANALSIAPEAVALCEGELSTAIEAARTAFTGAVFTRECELRRELRIEVDGE